MRTTLWFLPTPGWPDFAAMKNEARPLKINIILPFTSKTGGISVALEYACHLRGFGHDVRVYYPILPYRDLSRTPGGGSGWLEVLRGLRRNLLNRGREFSWHAGNPSAHGVTLISDWFVRDADVVIATAWPTAYSVAGLSLRKGRKFSTIPTVNTGGQRLQSIPICNTSPSTVTFYSTCASPISTPLSPLSHQIAVWTSAI